MHCRRTRGIYLRLAIGLTLCLATTGTSSANSAIYEPGADPGVGFNLISWGNFGNGTQVWQNAVQSIFDAGFDEVSLSPVRFYTPGSGSIASSSSSGPELSHVAAGVVRAKQLGMRVTVNPFVEPVGFSNWRGVYDPTPGSAESNTFWNDYQQYIVDVATMAQANGADSMTVGTELKALARNSGNNAKWTSVINAADTAFSGSLGYAANHDNYRNNNVRNTIWENPAIDFIGIDSYFTNLLNNAQADASGSYPNPGFINQVENAWNNKLDTDILPFAAARKGGTGMPVEFTEVGYLPHNRTTVHPQDQSQPVDRDEQNMAYVGLMRALDGRQASGNFLSTHIWNWGMQGTGGNLWDMGVSGSQPHPDNVQTSQWLSTFVKTKDTGGEPPTGATQILYSFEDGLDGFFYPNFESEPASTLAQTTSAGATDGSHSLAIIKPTSAWTWDARVQMSGDQLQILQNALADNINDYVLEIDVTYDASSLPAGLSDMNMHVSMETNLNSWSQNFPFAEISSPTNQTFEVEIPLNAFDLSGGISTASLHLGFVGQFSGNATIYIDRIALTDTTYIAPVDNADFDGDGDIDGADFLAWQRGVGNGNTLAQGDANGDGTVDAADLAIWQTQFGTLPPLAAAAVVPEPATCVLLASVLVVLLGRRATN